MSLPPAHDDVMGLAAGFPATSPDAWAELAAGVVNKSRPDDRKVDAAGAREALSSHLPGGIDIDPIYWPQPGETLGLPGAMPFTRGRGPRNPDQPWDVRQLHDDPDAAVSRQAVLDDLEHGGLLRAGGRLLVDGLVALGVELLALLAVGDHAEALHDRARPPRGAPPPGRGRPACRRR